MAVSPYEEKMLGIQHQLMRNQQDVQDYLSDLGNWAAEMKTKEQDLRKHKNDEPQDLPPVRNSLDKKKLKKKKKKNVEEPNKPKKISGSDFRAWDKYDVEKALQEIDGEEKKSSSEYETDEEWETERKKHLANDAKNKGNSHLSAGAYELAVECYTKGIELDPTNALLPANRALAFIKMERYGSAEVDCTVAITVDPLYVKAYLRRAAARLGLQHFASALEDYHRAIQLEPSNKQAKSEIDRLEKELQREKEKLQPASSYLERNQNSEVKAVYKPLEQRSKKPLRRIEIEEIGLPENTQWKAAIAKTESQMSSVKKELQAKDKQMFEKFTLRSSGDTSKNIKNTDDKCISSEPNITTDCNTQSLKTSEVNKGHSGQKVNKSENGVTPLTPTGLHSVISNRQKQDVSPFQSTVGVGSSTVVSLLDREPPQTSFQFQTDFKILRNNLQNFYTYFMRINPHQYSKLFGQSLEAPVLLAIIAALREYCIPANEDCFVHLKSLAEVKRFSMIIMFLSSKDKLAARDIFYYLKTQASHSEEEIDALMKKYDL